jgi:cytoskeleton protein RodZ
MPAIGDSLREARMRQKLDIADVEQRTKIRAKYLRALENEDFSVLPGSTFVRTFLRTYAEVLGLDPHVLVEEYRATYEDRDPMDLQPRAAPPPGRRERERRLPRGRPPGRGTVVVAALVALLAFLLVLGLVSGGGGGNKAKQSAGRGPAAEHRRKQRPRPPARLPTAVNLKVTPTVPTYVCVDHGPGTPVSFEGIIDGPRSFKAKKVRINLGKTSVRLAVNGKPFPVQQTGNPLGFEFSRTGHKQLLAGQRPCAAGTGVQTTPTTPTTPTSTVPGA